SVLSKPSIPGETPPRPRISRSLLSSIRSFLSSPPSSVCSMLKRAGGNFSEDLFPNVSLLQASSTFPTLSSCPHCVTLLSVFSPLSAPDGFGSSP
ncbi:hypothetical protein CSUI_005994, partial [Cystoisospora suis]